MTEHDEIVELSDRLHAKQRRSEAWETEASIEIAALPGAEQAEFSAFVRQRVARAEKAKVEREES